MTREDYTTVVLILIKNIEYFKLLHFFQLFPFFIWGRVFQDGGKRKWPIFAKRKSENHWFLRRKSEFQICCGGGIMVNLRAENGIRSQWWERNRHFWMSDLLPQRAEGEAAKFREGRRVIRKCNHFFHVFETKWHLSQKLEAETEIDVQTWAESGNDA